MSLKRKRSSDLSPLSTTSLLSRASQSPTPLLYPSLNGAMDVEAPAPNTQLWAWNRRKPFASSDLASRTRKRFRDNRPDERAIHGTPPPPRAQLHTSTPRPSADTRPPSREHDR